MNRIRIIFITVAAIALLAGLSFSIYAAVLSGSAWMFIVLGTLTLVGSALVYGFGEIVVSFQKK